MKLPNDWVSPDQVVYKEKPTRVWDVLHEAKLKFRKPVFTGGIATEYWLQRFSKYVATRNVSNIDVLVPDLSHVPRSVVGRFIAGFLRSSSSKDPCDFVNKQYLQLIYWSTGMKVHVFTHPYPPEDQIVWSVDGRFGIVSVEWLLAHIVFDLSRVFRHDDPPVDPKQFKDAAALLEVVNKDVLNKIWREVYQPCLKTSQNTAEGYYNFAKRYVHLNEYRVAVDPFKPGQLKIVLTIVYGIFLSVWAFLKNKW